MNDERLHHRFLVLRKISDQISLTRTIGNIASIIRDKQLIDIVQYILYELMWNVVTGAYPRILLTRSPIASASPLAKRFGSSSTAIATAPSPKVASGGSIG